MKTAKSLVHVQDDTEGTSRAPAPAGHFLRHATELTTLLHLTNLLQLERTKTTEKTEEHKAVLHRRLRHNKRGDGLALLLGAGMVAFGPGILISVALISSGIIPISDFLGSTLITTVLFWGGIIVLYEWATDPHP
ncbi:MAG: hypothetical protein ACHQX1_00750 [Candidatus Micrarchaeales archaeon]